MHAKRRGERRKPEPLTLEQMLVGGVLLVTNAAERTAYLRRVLLTERASSDDLHSSLRAFLLARDLLDAVIPMVRKRHREVKSAEIQAQR